VIKNTLNEYEKACLRIVEEFRDKYFEKDTEISFVCNNPTDVCEINDYWFCIDTMYQYLKYDYSKADMFGRYEEYTNFKDGNNIICIRDWRYFKDDRQRK